MLIRFTAFLHLKRNSSFNMVLFNFINKPFNDLGQQEIPYGQATHILKSHETTPASVMLHKGVGNHWKKNDSTVNYSVSIHYWDCDNTFFFSKSWDLGLLKWHNSSPPRVYHDYKLVQFEKNALCALMPIHMKISIYLSTHSVKPEFPLK